jgi:hypothetical protein
MLRSTAEKGLPVPAIEKEVQLSGWEPYLCQGVTLSKTVGQRLDRNTVVFAGLLLATWACIMD